jgi:hypothetical protein
MVSHAGFSVLHDSEVANYKRLEAAVLASEARRKEEQRQQRQKLGLPDVEDKRSFSSKILRKSKWAMEGQGSR